MKDIEFVEIFFYTMAFLFIAFWVYSVIWFIKFRLRLRSDDPFYDKTKDNWTYTSGKFTGKKYEKSMSFTKSGTQIGNHMEYEVLYYVDGEPYTNWYTFYPAPDAGIVTEGLGITVRYNPKKPMEFEIVKLACENYM